MNCDNCHQPIRESDIRTVVFDHRIFIVCDACNEKLANVIGPIKALLQMEPALRE